LEREGGRKEGTEEKGGGEGGGEGEGGWRMEGWEGYLEFGYLFVQLIWACVGA